MEILVIVLLILLNGVFSMSEIAMVSARKTRLDMLARKGSKAAKVALETAQLPNRFLSTVQIGITLIGILTGIFSGESMTKSLKLWLGQFPVVAPFASSLAVGLVVVFITYLSLVLGELVPKRIGLTNPEGVARFVAIPMRFLSLAVAPFVWFLTVTSDAILWVIRIKGVKDEQVTEDEIKAVIREGAKGGAIEEIEHELVNRVLRLSDRGVASVMTHRKDVVTIPISISKNELIDLIADQPHDAYPVYDESPENMVGVLAIKDLFQVLNEYMPELRTVIQPPKFILENASAYEVLKQFKREKFHHGLIIDEYGNFQGLISLSDLLGAIVEDTDESHEDAVSMIQRTDSTWLIDGRFPLTDFLHKLELPEFMEKYACETVSGLFLEEFRKIPKPGDKVLWLNYELEVLDMDGFRIDKLMLSRLP
jgi:putative hemolysin